MRRALLRIEEHEGGARAAGATRTAASQLWKVQGDAGLTGRKIIVDTYGGYARHGGGAFSGKDPTKVDRSAAYAARFVAKAIVAAGLAKRAEVQLSYAIGVAKPVSILVEAFGTGKVSNAELTGLVKEHFDLRPGAIIELFKLRQLPQQRGGRFYRDTNLLCIC